MSQSNDSVRFETDGPLVTITLSRPERRNAVDGPTALALRLAFERFEADTSLRVAVFTGDAGHFCAGADLAAMADPATRNGIESSGRAHGPMGPSRMAFSKPVIKNTCGMLRLALSNAPTPSELTIMNSAFKMLLAAMMRARWLGIERS